MPIDKSLAQAPAGLEDLQHLAGEPAIEIEVEDPKDLKIGVDGVVIDLMGGKEEEGESRFDENLAETMDDGLLDGLASDLIAEFDADVEARRDWTKMYVDGMQLLGLTYEEKSEPWEGACGVFHPIMSEAVVRFQAETIMETFPAAGPVKTVIIGKETPEKNDAADRVKADMNYQLTERMTEYRPEHERLLWTLPIAGSAFKKVYYDPSLARQVAMFIPPEDMVVPYGASNLECAERITHVMRKSKNELKKLMDAGFYREIELTEPTDQVTDVEKAKAEQEGAEATADDRFRILEMHVHIVLPGGDSYANTSKREAEKSDASDSKAIAAPYVVTIEKGTGKILSIRRNWYEEDVLRLSRQHFVHYTYVPGFGFYGFGLMHLVGGYAKSATSILRQLVDAGTLANLPGGFKANGLRVKGDDTPIAPGEFRDVDVPSGSIKENILPLPYKEPSATLYQLLQTIVEEGRRFASAADLQVSDMSANSPVGTTLAILERTLKVMSAVQARVHFAMKQEFKLLAGIIRDYTDDSYDYDVDNAPRQVKQSDYDQVDVIPVSDPNAATMSQKVVQYQTVMQMAENNKNLYNMPLLHRQMLDVMGVKNAAKLVPMDEDMKPKDPVTENMDILMGKPAKAFQYQDHEAHIAVHMSAMQDPKIMAMLQMNPNAKAIQAAGMAHLNEHLAYAYRAQIEKYMGAALPPMKDNDGEDVTLPNEVESQLAPLLAQAAQKLLQNNQAEMAQQQAQQKMQDPVIQIQLQELEIEKAEAARKAKKDADDLEIARQKLALEAKKIANQQEATGAQIGANVATAKAKVESQEKIEGARMGVDLLKTQSQTSINTELEGARMGVEIMKHHGDNAHKAREAQAQREEDARQADIDREHQRQEAIRQEAAAAKAAESKSAEKAKGSE